MITSRKAESIVLISKAKNKISGSGCQPQIFSYQINYIEQNNSKRNNLEDFVRAVYKKYYNVEIDKFYPNLLAIESKSTSQEPSIKAVAGIRSAESGALFSEYYLSNNLEKRLANIYNLSKSSQSISRKTIVEVGNLAPANIGQMRWLITSITAFLYTAGFKYIVFTGVSGISNAFKRMHIPLEVLAEARQECLPETFQNQWGPEYYKNNPLVFSGDILQGYEIMKKNIYNSNQILIPLFEKACQLGRKIHQVNNTSPRIMDDYIGDVA